MYKEIYRYEFRNRFRLFAGTLRNTWTALAGLVLAAGFFLYQLAAGNACIKPGEPVPMHIVRYARAAIAGVRVFCVLCSPSFTPVVRINAATILFTYNTPLFHRFIFRGWCRKSAWNMVFALIFGLILNGFLFDLRGLILFTELFLFITGTAFLCWIGYHGNKKEYWIASLGAALISGALFVPDTIQLPLLTAAALLAFLYVSFFLRMNVPKYYDRLCRLDAGAAAQSRNDFARMQQLAEENRPFIISGLTLDMLHPVKQTAVFLKGVIEILRIPKRILLLLFLLVLSGRAIAGTELFSSFPLLEVKEVRMMAGTLCLVMAINALSQMLVKQAKEVREKRLRGLSLPVSDGFVQASYALAAVILNLIAALILSFLFNRSGIKTLIFWGVTDAVYLLHSFTAIYELKPQRLFITAATIILLIGTYRCLIC